MIDVVDQLELYADDLCKKGSSVVFEPIMGKQFKIGYDDLRSVMRSAFQKHVRRGHDYAHKWGHYLFIQDQTYAWATLHTIIIEDIGMGNSKLCALMGLATLKNWRKRVVQNDAFLFHGLIAEALTSNKNRSPCELSVLANAINFTLGDNDPTDEFLIGRMLPPMESAKGVTARLEMYQAATFLRARSRNGNSELLHRVLNGIRQYYDDEWDAAIAMLTWERPIDPMNNGIHALMPNRGAAVVLPDREEVTFTPCEPYQGIPLSALDQHTELGRNVFKRVAPYVCKAIKTDKVFLVEQTIGALVFFEEGALVNNFVMTNEEAGLMTIQQEAYLKRKHKGLVDPDAVRDALFDMWDTHVNPFRMEILIDKVVKSV